VIVALMAAIALANDLPPILLAVSRLFFAWAEDGIFPRGLAAVNARFNTPHWALTASALVASIVAVGCNLHGFFMGIDVVVIALCFTYILIAVSVLTFPRRNPTLYADVAFMRSRPAQWVCAIVSILTIGALLYTQVVADLGGLAERITAVGAGEGTIGAALAGSIVVQWMVVILVGSLIFLRMWRAKVSRGEDPEEVFRTLPEEAEALDPLEPRI
jgi:amino acid transporter